MNELESLVLQQTDFLMWDTFKRHKDCPPFQVPFSMRDFADFVALMTSAWHTSTNIPVEDLCAVIEHKLNIVKKHYAV